MHVACHDWRLHLESSQSKRDSYRDNALKSGRHSTRGFVHNEVGQISSRSQIIPTTFHVRSGSCIALWSLRFESLEKFGDLSPRLEHLLGIFRTLQTSSVLSNLDEHTLTHELIVREVKLQVKLPACLGLVDLSFFFKNF